MMINATLTAGRENRGLGLLSQRSNRLPFRAQTRKNQLLFPQPLILKLQTFASGRSHDDFEPH